MTETTENKPTLYLVATPIGNLSDITLRAIETLRSVDYVASEDTRKTGRLLKHLEITKPQISFHEHNERRAGPRILGMLQQGLSVAVVSNAGTPGISDPGFTLVRDAVEAEIEVTMIPGPCAIMALVLSSMPAHSFTFKGFAPRSAGKRTRFLAAEADSPHTLVFYESPYRLKTFLTAALETLGDRRAALARELTKMFESVQRGRLSQLIETIPEKPKGEFVIVIAPPDK